MRRSYIVALGRHDFLLALKVLGIRTVEVESPEEVHSVLEEICRSMDKDVILILIEDELVREEDLFGLKFDSPLPLIIRVSLPEEYVDVLKGILTSNFT